MTATRKKKGKIPDWLVMGDGCVRCLRCGKREMIPVPMPADAFGPWAEYAGSLHAHCKDVGRVDVPAATIEEWRNGPDTGTSSKAIYQHMSGRRWGTGMDYPYDPSDFGRCYRLLLIAPEWRGRIKEMAHYGPEWAALSGAWDELTALWEEESKGTMAPKLYDRMRELRYSVDREPA